MSRGAQRRRASPRRPFGGVRITLRGHRLAAVIAVAFAALASAGIGLAWFVYAATRDLPVHEVGRLGEMAQATRIFDVHDDVAFTIFREHRIEVPLERISPHVVEAVIAVEDQRFYRHRGFDLVRILGAALANLREGRTVQGGSTITQQLARQSLLTTDKTLRRKIREVLLAARIEQAYTKPEILELYLNKVYFGNGFHGIETASRGYFGKSASELELAEAALLAGLIRSPSSTAPTANPKAALARRDLVLRLMVESGAIAGATGAEAMSHPVLLSNGLAHGDGFGLYFKEAVRQQLVDRFGWARVSEGGLRVFTTLDVAMQRAAERSVEESLHAIESRGGYPHAVRAAQPAAGDGAPATDYLQAALVAMDPGTGHVRAMVGGRSFAESPFNRVTQARRQPGSAFKPLVFATALESGLTPASVLTDLDDPVLTPEGDWLPDEDHDEEPFMTVRAALRVSSNRAAVRLLRTVGIDRTVEYVDHMQLGRMPRVPSIVLGSGEVTLDRLTAAYGAFADGGIVHAPRLIRRVEDATGTVLWEPEPAGKRVFSETTAFLMANMLAEVVDRGTAYRARSAGFRLPAAGKTGTTNDYHDAWFVGFTPSLVTGVWIGFDKPRPIVRRGYAGELAVPLWAQFMKTATEGHPAVWFDEPDGIVSAAVCRISGRLPAAGCSDVEEATDTGAIERRSMIYTEYFQSGTEPQDYCHLHPGPGLFERLARTLGGNRRPAHPSTTGVPVELSAPPPPAKVAKPAPAAEPPAPEPVDAVAEPKKRGFWGKVFGIFGKRDRSSSDAEGEEPEDGPTPQPFPKPRRPPPPPESPPPPGR